MDEDNRLKRACSECRWFLPWLDVEGKPVIMRDEMLKRDVPLGHCHARPPMVFVPVSAIVPNEQLRTAQGPNGKLMMAKVPTGGSTMRGEPAAAWPLVRVDDYCGEFLEERRARRTKRPEPEALSEYQA